MRQSLIFLLFTCTLLSACTCCSKKTVKEDAPSPVTVSKALFTNPDSILYYAQRAYLQEDPQALFITAAAAYLRSYGDLPDSLTTVSLDEADIMLLRAAELGNTDALQMINRLQFCGTWSHSIPEDK